MGHPWEQRKLGEISTCYSGGTPKVSVSEYYGGKIPFIRSAEINSPITELFLTESGLKNSSAKWVSKGDLLYALYGATSGEVGISRINGAINQAILAIKPTDSINTGFLAQQLKAKKAFITNTYLQGGQGNLSADIVKSIEIEFPSLLEQNKIAQLFLSFENLITLHQRKLDLLKEKKKGLLQKMFPKPGENKPELRFSGFTDPWKQRKVGELFKVTRGNVLAATETSTVKSNETPYPVYSSQTKDNGLMGFYKDYLYEDAITWTTDGANAGTVQYRTGRFYCTNVCGVLLSSEVRADPMIAEAIGRVSKAYVSYVGNPKLMNNVMENITIKIPVLSEERKLLSMFFTELDDRITLHQRKLDLLKEKKKGLLQKMFPKPGQQEPELRFSEFR